MLMLAVRPGFILAILFVLFNHVTLRVIDSVLSRVVSLAYYRRVYTGRPVVVASADIIPFTSYLLENALQPINMYALSVKLSFIVAITMMTQRINSGVTKRYDQMTVMSTLQFDPSSDTIEKHELNARRWTTAGECRQQNESGIFYYSIVFNLSKILKNTTLSPGNNKDLPSLDYSTLLCLSPPYVEPVREPIMKVLRCSKKTKASDCNSRNEVSKQLTSTTSSTEKTARLHREGSEVRTVRLKEYNDAIIEKIWNDYPNPTLTCTDLYYGTDREDPDMKHTNTECLLVCKTDVETIVEMWHGKIDSSEENYEVNLTRYYPGAVFNGSVNLGVMVKAIVLTEARQDMNWDALSWTIFVNSLSHKSYLTTVAVWKEDEKLQMQTMIPRSSLITGGVLLLTTFLSVLGLHFVMKGDRRPRFNTINGLSSIMREEKVSTENSMAQAQLAIVGFRELSPGHLHFGVLKHFADFVHPRYPRHAQPMVALPEKTLSH